MSLVGRVVCARSASASGDAAGALRPARPLLLASKRLAIAATLISGTASAASGEGATSLQLSELPVGYAALAFESPVAVGGSWGSVGIAGLYGPGSAGHDASMAVALGLGDPDDYAGLDVAAVISSLSHSDGGPYGFGDEGSFALKLHRNLGDYTAIAIGASAIGRWGGEVYKSNNPAGHYLALTRAIFIGDHVLMLSGGAGHNVSNKNGEHNDIFGSASFYLTTWLSLIVEDNYRYANAAISLAPLPRWLPLTITAGYVDLASRYNPHPELSVTAGIGYQF